MKADALSPRQLFDGKVHYEVPPFQRPYVWNEDDQWAPLWADVIRVAESHLNAGGSVVTVPHHFLGAVVYESLPPIVGDVTRHVVIDGQQRTTTLQLMIDAVQAVVADFGYDLLAEDLEELVLNRSTAFRGTPKRFKLRPSRIDRDAFAHAMDPQGEWQGGEHRIIDAHRFFGDQARAWISGTPDDDGEIPPGTQESRAQALAATLRDQLYMVAINLTGHDDSQLIFETLNDRGTPLLKADLIKNWVFQHGEKIGADIEEWSGTHWVDFDDDWWRDEIVQGRQQRSRIDIFVQYWLTMRRTEEVKTEQVFRVFTEYAKPFMADADSAGEFLRAFRRDADTYRALSNFPENTAAGSFYHRIVETIGLAATSPLLMWLVSDNHKVPAQQVAIALGSLESWVIRRTLLRMTMKDVNKTMVSALKVLGRASVADAGETVRNFLASQRADARAWPTDDAMKSQLPSLRLYGNIAQYRLRIVLTALEQKLRTDFNEKVSLPERLEIEHVMPQGWRSYWDRTPPLDHEAAAARDHRVHTLGNLTLVAKSLNGSLSNRPWTDDEASAMTAGGESGLGKRSLLEKYSLLVLSKNLTNDHVDVWTDADIEARSTYLTDVLCEIWPGPPAQVEPLEELEGAKAEEEHGSHPHLDWTDDELAGFAGESTTTTLALLDHVATNLAGRPFTGDEATDSGFNSGQVSGISGAMARRTYSKYRRSNPPLEFVMISGRWHYRMDPDLAERWRTVRGL